MNARVGINLILDYKDENAHVVEKIMRWLVNATIRLENVQSAKKNIAYLKKTLFNSVIPAKFGIVLFALRKIIFQKKFV